MAYGLKYELLCTTKKSKAQYKAKIYFNDYTDADIDRNVPVNPFILKKERAGVIHGTSFEFSIREEVDFEFLEFYTNIPKYIKVELTDASDTQLWVGWLDTQQYSCPYIPTPLNVKFTASDGLGLLKNYAFTLTGRNSQLAIIKHCLDKIGLDLGYAIAITIHDLLHNTSLSPLDQTFEDSETFGALNCYEVIEKILEKYDSTITQWKGRWRIVCSRDKKATRLLYNSAGTYTGTEEAPAVLDLGYPGDGIEVTPAGTLNLSLEPGGKQVHLIHEYGRKSSLLDNYEFKDFADGAFDAWEQTGIFDVTQGDLNGQNFAYLEGYSEDADDGIAQSIAFDNSGGESFVFELDYCAIGYLINVYKRLTTVPVRFLVELTDGINAYWLNLLEENYGEWTTTPTVIELTGYASREIPEFKHIKIQTDPPPISGFISVQLCRIYGTPPGPNYHWNGVCFSKPVVNLIGGDAETVGTRYEATASFDNSTEPVNLPDINILNADAPSAPNASILYRNITFRSDDTLTGTNWTFDDWGTRTTLITLLFKMLASRNRVSRQVLQGNIKGAAIGFDSIIRHAYNNNREFEIAECIWDIYQEKFNCKMLEILSWSNENITITLGAPTSNTSAPSSGSSGVITSRMTPMEILGLLLMVDGMGSNLDADSVDGLHASAFALEGHEHTGTPAAGVLPFQYATFGNPLNIDATFYKDWICTGVNGAFTFNLNNTTDGDAGMAELIVGSTGSDAAITFGTMFTKKMGPTDFVGTTGTDNVISWRKTASDIIYTIGQIE